MSFIVHKSSGLLLKHRERKSASIRRADVCAESDALLRHHPVGRELNRMLAG